MKTAIFYFSGTGNSLKVARDIADELGDTELIFIPKVISNSEISTDAERVGIVYPVYMWGMPLIVADFIKKLKLDNHQYIFAVATYGGMVGNALGQTDKELGAKGLKLSSGFCVMMPGNYTPLYGAIPAEKQKGMFKNEREKIKDIAAVIREGKKLEVDKSHFIIRFVFSGLLYKLFSPKIRTMDKNFWVDENCNSCGICQKVCPVNNIKISGGKPSWLGKCEQCLACLQWCPTEAIQSGKKTPGRKRYRNPDVTLKDFTQE